MNKRSNPFPAYNQPLSQAAPPAQQAMYSPHTPAPPPHSQEWAAYYAQSGYPQPPQPTPNWHQPAQATAASGQAPAYDPALYRNYGYGGSHNSGWQHQQQAAPRPPPPPPPPPAYPSTQPYSPAYPHPGPYGHPYAQPQPPPALPPVAAPPPAANYTQAHYYPVQVSRPPLPHQSQPPHSQAQAHQQPPAKRPRFDSSHSASTAPASIPPRPPQPPPLHFKPGGGMVPASQLNKPNGTRGGGVPLGIPGGRGGGQMGNRGRGGGIAGMGRGGGRAGGTHGHSGSAPMAGIGRGGMMGGRGGMHGNPRSGQRGGFRQNQSGNRFPMSGSQAGKSHNLPTGPMSRHDRSRMSTASSDSSNRGASSTGLPTSTSFNFTPSSSFRGMSPFSGSGKRTLTDFRIVGFGVTSSESDDETLVDLDWTWGTVPSKQEVKAEVPPSESGSNDNAPVSSMEKLRVTTSDAMNDTPKKSADEGSVTSPTKESPIPSENADDGPSSPSVPTSFKLSSTNSIPVLPRPARLTVARAETSRIRIYFQCPAEFDDKEIGSSGMLTPVKTGRTWTVIPPTPGGMKRKKEDEDDEEDEERKQREGGKRKREDSDLLPESGEGEKLPLTADAPGSASGWPKSPKSELEVEEEMKFEESIVESEVRPPEQEAQHVDDRVEALVGRDAQLGQGDGASEVTIEEPPAMDAPYEGDPQFEDDAPQEDWTQMSWNQETGGAFSAAENESDGPVDQADAPPAQDSTVPNDGAPTEAHSLDVSTSLSNTVEGRDEQSSPTLVDNSAANSEVAVPDSVTPLKEVAHRAGSVGPAAPSSNAALPSPNRISISYAGSTRRLVIDADVVENIRIRRGVGRIDVTLSLSPQPEAGPISTGLGAIKEEVEDGDSTNPSLEAIVTKDVEKVEESPSTKAAAPAPVGDDMDGSTHPSTLPSSSNTDEIRLKGILVDALDEGAQTYRALSPGTSDSDLTIPPLAKYLATASSPPVKVKMVLYLDKEKPLSEPKWVKTGDIEDWLRSMFGQTKTDSQAHASWSGKIAILDPDQPTNVYTVIDSWAQQSALGPPKERRRFASDHLRGNFENLFEILLRLVRLGYPAPTAQATPGSVLTSALDPDSIYAAQQTPVSLAVLALLRMSTDFATQAGVENKALETRVGQIIRALPQQMLYKSLDGMFKEWMANQKKVAARN